MKASAESKLRVEASRRHEEWTKAMHAASLDLPKLHKLMWEETPGVAFYELKAFLSGVRPGWRPVLRDGSSQRGQDQKEPTKKRLAEIFQEVEQLRDRMGSEQRKLDLGWLRHIRRDGHLSLYLGGGSRSLKNNIGFLWNLILHLVTCASSIAERTSMYWYQYLVEEVCALRNSPLSKSAVCCGARTASIFFNEGLFRNIVQYTYALSSTPGRVHRAIAELSEPVTVSNEAYPGLRVLVTQSIDDLVGEAIDDLGLRRRTISEVHGLRVEETNSREITGRPTEPRHGRRARLRTEQLIYHTHGWIPRRTENRHISDNFTSILADFSGERLATGAKISEKDEADAGIQLQKLIAPTSFLEEASRIGTNTRKSHVVLLGLSFDDSVTETLLAQWSRRDTWPQYFALLRWPAERMGVPYPRASGEAIREASKPFFQHLVQPLWFDSADEIPDLLREML